MSMEEFGDFKIGYVGTIRGDSGSNIHGFSVCLLASFNSENISFLEFQIFNNFISNNEVNFLFVTLCVVLLFVIAIDKSAQLSLHVWLPYAMEWPK